MTSDKAKLYFDDFAESLLQLAGVEEITPGIVIELVEYATEEQNKNWVEYSPGWNVLESFKDFVRTRNE